MAVTVKKIVLWRKEVQNKPGALAGVLGPLAEAGANLEVVMGTSLPDDAGMASIGVFPVKGKKSVAAAEAVGLRATPVPALLVQGPDRPGLGHGMTRMVADAGIDIGFMVAQVLGRNFSAIYGFASEADAGKAATLIKKAIARKPPVARKAAGAKKPARSPKAKASARRMG